MNDHTRPLRCASWAAVSSKVQAAEDKVSLPYQLETNREHAARIGGEIIVELIVPGESRFIPTWEEACDRIDAYARLRDLIEAKAVDVLIYYDRSRLARMASLGMTIDALAQRAGILLYETSSPPRDLTPGYRHSDALVNAINAVGAQHQVHELVARRRRGMIKRAQRGEFPQKPNYGYRYHYSAEGVRTVRQDPTAADVVRRVFREYLEGSGLTNIALRLNSDGNLSPTGAPWTQSSLVRMLDNVSVYAGYITINRRSQTGAPVTVARAAFDPIIDDATMRRVIEERQQRLVNRHIPNSPYLLSGLCRCTACDGPMIVHHNEHRKQPYKYIVCKHCKPTYAIRESVVMAKVTALISLLPTSSMLPTLDDRHHAQHQAQLERNAAHLKSLQDKVARVDAAYADGVLALDRYKAQLERIRKETLGAEAERVRIMQGIVTEQDIHDWQERMQELRDHGLEILASDDIPKANAWLRRHLRILCSPDQTVEVESI